ncbi:MAG: DUF935 domain-containing protein, partial [Magnetospirillum sp.]|nr:DUF935 domain-containing protein [Magnetospirillum sp.]
MIQPVVLYGPDNRPLKKADLKQPVAAPALTGVRTIWTGKAVASGLTPERLASLLMRAAEGDHEDFLILAEEMEERELHYASVLGTRKRALSGLDPAVAAATDAARDVQIADAVRNLAVDPYFPEMVDDLLDALGKGYSVVEIMWAFGKLWKPAGYEYRDPRWFRFDQVSGRKLLLLDDQAPMGMPLPAFKFITHIPRLKSGLPIRGGLARLAAWSFMFKSYTVKDWMAFIEVFGMPLRLGKYGPSASEDDIDTLVRAVSNIGTDAAAVMPESMKIEFQETASAKGGHEVFK